MNPAGYPTRGGPPARYRNVTRGDAGGSEVADQPWEDTEDDDDALASTDDPKELIPGEPAVLLAAAAALRDRDVPAFENAGKHLRTLDVGGWRGLAADGFHPVADLVAIRWYRYAELVPKAAAAIETYAHQLAWAQRQARVAAQRWAEAERLGADTGHSDRHGGRRDDDRERLDAAASERQAVRDTLRDARRDLAEAESRLATRLDALTRELPMTRALDNGSTRAVVGVRGPAQLLRLGASRIAPPTTHAIPADPAAPSGPGNAVGPAAAPTHSSSAPSPTPTPAPTPTPPAPSPPPLPYPPVTITLRPYPTTPSTDLPARPPHPPALDPPMPDTGRHQPRPADHGGYYPPDLDPPDLDPPADRPPAPTRHTPAPRAPSQPGPPLDSPPPAPPADPAPDNPEPGAPPAARPSPTRPLPGGAPAGTGHPPPTDRPWTPEPDTPGAQTPTASAPPQPGGDRGGDLAPALAVGGAAAAVVGGAAGVAWVRSRRAYPIGSGRRDDYPPAEPVVHELRHTPPATTTYREPDTGPGTWTASSGHHPGATDQPAAAPRTAPPAPPRTSPPSPPPPAEAPEPSAADTPPVTLDLTAAPGIGIQGNGATDTLRAMLVALLTADAEWPPARVLIPVRDCDWILGTSQPAEPLPETLQIVPDLGHALDILDTEVQQRTHHREPDPPLVLILAHPPTDPTTRDTLAEILDDGHRHAVTALILGDWSTGNTLAVAHDGTITTADGPATDHLPGTTLAGLTTQDALALLTDLAHPEHTPDPTTREHASDTHPPAEPNHAQPPPEAPGQPATPGPDHAAPARTHTPATPTGTDTAPRPRTTEIPQPSGAVEPLDDPDAPLATRRPPAGTAPSPPLRLLVLGRVSLTWTPPHTGDQPPADGGTIDITPKQAELLTFLALHPDGVARDTLADTLWPRSRPQRPANGLHSTLRRLRRTLTDTTHGAITDLITIGGDGTYRLDPALVEVPDLHQLTTTLAAPAGTNPDEHTRALALYRGELAEGTHPPSGWITIYREHLRRDALDTAAHLAHTLTNQGKQHQAITVLDKARRIDPYNESTYQHIMRLQLELGQPDAAKRTLNLLTIKLHEIDAQPTNETLNIIQPRQEHQQPHNQGRPIHARGKHGRGTAGTRSADPAGRGPPP